jgi:hypothetical protein
MNEIEYCIDCVAVATWFYAPSTDGKDSYCDDCVPRGCPCNYEYIKSIDPEYGIEPPEDGELVSWMWVDKECGHWEHLDDQGRRYPCCEFFPIQD